MGHAVMTHTQTQSTVNYTHLPTGTQDLFDQLMEQADNTASNTEYTALMKALITVTGITGVRHGEILKCACACDCPAIFDADAPDALVTEPATGYNLGRLQCPDCADDHPQPVTD
ncbi:hypothetical protein AB0G98_21425 [Streptomyces sp. NPDC020196]|uniref:hypothetical protein n=1 Tax=Streptomyces sp. NPDC020196 TaxID=3156656 RepID=UPI0033FE8FF8